MVGKAGIMMAKVAERIIFGRCHEIMGEAIELLIALEYPLFLGRPLETTSRNVCLRLSIQVLM
jgi:hypothetical protein